MRNDLTAEHLAQVITVDLPLSALLSLGAARPAGPLSERLHTLRADRPVIGQKGLYGLYAGIARGYGAEPDGILELLEAKPEERLTWDEATKWADSVGGRLPTRKEQALLFANVPEQFETDYYYWSCEQHESNDDYAWLQTFSYGYQLFNVKGNKHLARAVRRVSLVTLPDSHERSV